MWNQNVVSSKNATPLSVVGSTHALNAALEVDLKTLFDLLGMEWTGASSCLTERLQRRRVAAGQQLIVDREQAKALYIVRTGAFKTVSLDVNGVAQIIGFPMRGEMLGVDGFSDGKYSSNVFALEDSDVIVLPLHRLAELAQRYPGFEQLVYRGMAKSLVRDQSQLWALGSQCAGARLAHFLLKLSAHYAQSGYSANSFMLRMTRTELASFLGLTIETISRTFSTLHSSGVLEIDNRQIHIRDLDGLKQFCISGERTSTKSLAKTVRLQVARSPRAGAVAA